MQSNDTKLPTDIALITNVHKQQHKIFMVNTTRVSRGFLCMRNSGTVDEKQCMNSNTLIFYKMHTQHKSVGGYLASRIQALQTAQHTNFQGDTDGTGFENTVYNNKSVG